MENDYLKEILFLKGLNEADLAQLGKWFRVLDAAHGHRIVAQGEPVDSIYVVLKGTVHARRVVNQREMFVGRITEGSFFGEINFFDPQSATAHIYAMDNAKLAVISHDHLRQFMENNPVAGYRIMAVITTEICKRFRQSTERLAQSAFWSA